MYGGWVLQDHPLLFLVKQYDKVKYVAEYRADHLENNFIFSFIFGKWSISKGRRIFQLSTSSFDGLFDTVFLMRVQFS